MVEDWRFGIAIARKPQANLKFSDRHANAAGPLSCIYFLDVTKARFLTSVLVDASYASTALSKIWDCIQLLCMRRVELKCAARPGRSLKLRRLEVLVSSLHKSFTARDTLSQHINYDCSLQWRRIRRNA